MSSSRGPAEGDCVLLYRLSQVMSISRVALPSIPLRRRLNMYPDPLGLNTGVLQINYNETTAYHSRWS